MDEHTYSFYGISEHIPKRRSNVVNRSELTRAIRSNPFTSIDNMRSLNKWMKDTMYLGTSLVKVS